MRYPNIEAERARLGISKQELARLLNVSRKTYYNWITKGRIPEKKICQMAELFSTTVDYLLNNTVT